jgi:4-hydroxybenzoate polyprenyltransferase
MSAVVALIKTLRPHQWVKNLFVAAPLVFAKRLTDADAALTTVIAVAAFCALSGAVYAINDVLDVEKDRAHPTKRRRPIASGALSMRVAVATAVVLALGGMGTAFALSWKFGAVAAVYLVQNLAYSLQIKHVAWLDVAAIALGFLLRVLGGSFAIDVVPSFWLLVCTGLLAAFVGFGKRAHELVQATSAAESGQVVGSTRRVLQNYRLEHLNVALHALGAATTVAYGLYTLSAHTVSFFGTRWMVLTVPFCALGIWRFMRLVTRQTGETGDGPTEAMLRDWLFMANLALWGASVVAIIYLG